MGSSERIMRPGRPHNAGAPAEFCFAARFRQVRLNLILCDRKAAARKPGDGCRNGGATCYGSGENEQQPGACSDRNGKPSGDSACNRTNGDHSCQRRGKRNGSGGNRKEAVVRRRRAVHLCCNGYRAAGKGHLRSNTEIGGY